MAILLSLISFAVSSEDLIHHDEKSGITVPGEFDLTSFELKIRRGGCFGPCPIYDVLLKGDGSVQFKGQKFVAIVGERSKHLDSNKVNSIISKLYESKFFYFPLEYRDYRVEVVNQRATVLIHDITDIPTPYIEVIVGDFKKSFISTPSAPPEAAKLISEIEAMLDISDWVEKANQSLKKDADKESRAF
ncbi:DUF6438 domain-containing protein [Aliikangiella sp. IMCC44653]